MAENAARAAELGAPGIDINFGCPAKRVNRSDGGAIILRDPDRVYAITSAVRKAVDPSIPVTVKTRLGYEDHLRFLDIVAAVEAASATELTIHARTKRHGYRPPAYWEEIAKAREQSHLPIIANGEIWHPDDALRCQQITGCTDLMLGRGVMVRPDLPRLIAANAQGKDLKSLHWPELPPLILHFYELNLQNYDSRYAPNPVKQWLVYLRSYFPQAALLFESIKRLRDPQEVGDALRLAVELSTP